MSTVVAIVLIYYTVVARDRAIVVDKSRSSVNCITNIKKIKYLIYNIWYWLRLDICWPFEDEKTLFNITISRKI